MISPSTPQDGPETHLRGVLVLAKQRAGTNFLRSMLAETGGLRDFGEVFQPRQPDGLSKYHRWLASVPPEQAEAVTHPAAIDRAEAFLAALETEGFPCIDVKYNSALNAIGTWYSPVELPPVLAAALRRGYLVIHLQRRNRLEHAVSSWIAGRTGRYVDRGANAHEGPETYEIPPHAVTRIARTYDLEAEMVGGWLSRARGRARPDQIMELAYEDMAGAAPEALSAIIADILGRCGITMSGGATANTRKLLPDWRQTVSNAEILEQHFTEDGKLRLAPGA
ncbi:hypothetical protein [Mesobacterium pallidum]|uniref:hypothetical protein n=1 Tax=Mesobacterium pallidum TaxID=2872037 RepID=UPI001EE32B5A|nr:hypothetical protein [Mesobacterium pallidum]